MKRIVLLIVALVALSVVSASAQYRSMTYECSQPLRIVQIDEGENSVIVYFTFTAPRENYYIKYLDDDCYVKQTGGFKKYKPLAIAGIGLDSDHMQSMVRKAGGEMNFAVEFEKFPLDKPFDIIESDEGNYSFNFFGVTVDKSVVCDKMLVEDFLAYAPAPRTGVFYEDGSNMRFWSEDGLVITAHFVTSDEYGKLFKIYMEIANDTGRSIDFITSNISVTAEYKTGMQKDVKVLSYNDFDTKVVNTLGWYSNSTPQSRLSDSFRYMANDRGRNGDTGGAAAFGAISLLAAAANAQNEANFRQALQNERESAVSSYLLSNTLKNGAVYGGFVAVKDNNSVSAYHIKLKIGKKEYLWDCNKK